MRRPADLLPLVALCSLVLSCPGNNVSSGDPGPDPAAMEARITALEAQVAALSGDTGTLNDTANPIDWSQLKSVPSGFADAVDSGGMTYIRWGRNECPTTATLVYAGYAGGKSFDQGSGRNLLCLSDVPTWDDFNDNDQNGGLVYGLEFETTGYGLSQFLALNNFESPCAVCYAPDRTISLMIPGTQVCPTDWTTEYQGYLMSQFFQQNGSEFVCVDRVPTAIGSSANQNGALLYPVEAECGSLPCPPYVQNREVTCAMCSR